MQSMVSGQRPWRRFLRTTRVAQPAAGADWSFTVPGSELWELLTVYATLTTSAAVATRTPSMIVGDGSVTFGRMPGVANQAASIVNVMTWGPFGSQFGLTNIQRNILLTKYLNQGETIGTQTDLIDVADQWSNVIIRAIVTVWQDGPVDMGDLDAIPVVVVSSSDS